MLNKGLEISGFSVFTESGMLSIYVPCSTFYNASFVTVKAGSVSQTYSNALYDNKVTSIAAVTAHITTGTDFRKCPLAGVFNYGAADGRILGRYIATEDGDDLKRGESRANSYKTIAQALRVCSNSNYLSLTINRHVTAPPAAYSASKTYVKDDKV
jgi:hypothetical protein